MSGGLTFSIIIPAYNRSAVIGRAIASCLLQDHPAFEVIVVDDGSTDGTAKRVSEIVDPRLRLLAQPVNRGVSPARTWGWRMRGVSGLYAWTATTSSRADALALMEADIQRASPGVDGFRFMCRLDDGSRVAFAASAARSVGLRGVPSLGEREHSRARRGKP